MLLFYLELYTLFNCKRIVLKIDHENTICKLKVDMAYHSQTYS